MGIFSSGFYKIVTFIFISLTAALVLPQLSTVIFPRLAEPSPEYDCDDATLAMYRHFQGMGIESTPIVGNLDLEGEKYEESNHVWLLVDSGDKRIAYDWGVPRFDRQHYEGYTITLDYLLSAVADDIDGRQPFIIAER